jgi:uncharacterized membrane protein YphA (DoxX/SURF4 family)
MQGKKTAKEIAIWIPTLLLVLMFTNAGVRKFFEHGGWTIFFRRYGFPDWFRYTIGVVETAAAALLLFPRTVVYGAAIVIVTMIGAIGSMLLHHEMRGLVPPTVAMIVAALLAIARWRQRVRLTAARPLAPQQ